MNPRRLHRATIFSIVTMSAGVGVSGLSMRVRVAVQDDSDRHVAGCGGEGPRRARAAIIGEPKPSRRRGARRGADAGPEAPVGPPAQRTVVRLRLFTVKFFQEP